MSGQWDIDMEMAIFPGQFCLGEKGVIRLTLCEAATKARPQHRELRALLFAISLSVWVLERPLLTM